MMIDRSTIRMMIDRSTLRRASEIYLDLFGVDMMLSTRMVVELLEVEQFADFEALQDDLSAGEYDAIEAAMGEQS